MICLKNVVRQFLIFGLLATFLYPVPATAAETLNRIKARGSVRCGVGGDLQGYSLKDADGHWSGMDVDFCRALASAVLGDPEKVKFTALTAAARFPSLKSGEVDVLVRNTTWTMEREAVLGVLFAGVLYYDSQSFLVPSDSNLKDVRQLDGATICAIKGSTHEKILSEYFRSHQLSYQPLIVESQAKAAEALFSGQCRAFTSERTQLTAVRLKSQEKSYEILSGQISEDPMGPVVRSDDDEWFTVVRWVLFTLVRAEMAGFTQANVTTRMGTGDDWFVQQRSELDGLLSKALGFQPGWFIRVISAAGNYGEIFERNLGQQSPLKLDRGLNQLYTRGGLMVAPPFR